jgi:hypothetical protein
VEDFIGDLDPHPSGRGILVCFIELTTIDKINTKKNIIDLTNNPHATLLFPTSHSFEFVQLMSTTNRLKFFSDPCPQWVENSPRTGTRIKEQA